MTSFRRVLRIGIWVTATPALAAVGLLAQNPSDMMSGEAESNATMQGPEALNTAQQARLKLGQAKRSLAQFDKLEAQLAQEPAGEKKQKLREKAQKQFDSATADFQAALKIDPRLVEAHVGLAELMLRAGKVDPAIQTLDRALEIDPKSLDALALRGRAQLAGFRVADAKATYESIAAASAEEARRYLAEMRTWLQAQRSRLGPEMKDAIDELDRWIRERES